MKKVFANIDRAHARGETYDMELIIDINRDLWSVGKGDKVAFALASTLSHDGSADDGTFSQQDGPSLLDRVGSMHILVSPGAPCNHFRTVS